MHFTVYNSTLSSMLFIYLMVVNYAWTYQTHRFLSWRSELQPAWALLTDLMEDLEACTTQSGRFFLHLH